MNIPFYAHASLPSGENLTFTVDRPDLLIGRTRAAQLRLLHQTVSGQHARITRDTRGNWFLEDLGSRNGLVTKGARVERVQISDGATVEIGSFLVSFSSSQSPPRERKPQPPAHTQQIDISRLGERDTASTSRQRIAEIAAHGQRLWAIDSDDDRRHELCNILLSPLMEAWSATVIRLDPTDHRASILATARRPDAPDAVTDYVSQSMLRAIAEDPAPALGRTHAVADGEINLSIAPGVSTLAAMVCRLEDLHADLDVLFVTLPPHRAQQSALLELAMIAEQYRGAAAAAALRHHRAESARREQELDQARRIQENLLPVPARAAEHRVIIHAQPCTEVGGDYADVIPLDDHRTLLAIADVAGKGMHAALIAAQIHSLCNYSLRDEDPLPDLAARLNRLLAQHMDMALFASALLAIVDRRHATLHLVNAGHPPALLASRDNAVTTIAEAPGPPLGVLDEPPPVATHTFSPGDTLLLYTDGLSETPTSDSTLLGVEGVTDLFAAAASEDPSLERRAEALARRLAELNAATGVHRHDDQTFLLAAL